MQKWRILFDGRQTNAYDKECEGCTQFVTDGVKAKIDVKCKKIGMTALSFVEICEHNYYLYEMRVGLSICEMCFWFKPRIELFSHN